MKLVAQVLLALCGISAVAHGQRTHDKMYKSINGASCFRRLNGTHSTGCSSKFGGSVGALHYVANESDIDFVMNRPPAPPYVVILPPELFTRDIVMRLKTHPDQDTIAGLVLINSATPKQFSQESRCPNQYSGLLKDQTCDVKDASTAWNPFGTGLLQEHFPFPIFYVEEPEEIKKMLDCHTEFNVFDRANQASRPLCSIELNSFMAAAVNSEICYRRSMAPLASSRFCDPLQGKNVYATLLPRPKIDVAHRRVDEKEKIIVISSRMDTTSMFEAVGYGAKDSLVSFATLVSTAHFLANVVNSKVMDRNVLFVLFNGESYDYIGSQRFVYDLKNGTFPESHTATNALSLDSIELLIDLGTLDDLNSLQVYHATDFNMLTNFTEFLQRYNSAFGFNLEVARVASKNLPPVSAQSFLRENITFPAAIVTSTPNNRYYHSIYDSMININYTYHNTSKDFTQLDVLADTSVDFTLDSVQMKIRNVSTAIGMSVFELLMGSQYDGKEGASSILIDEFLYCFLESADCPLFRAASLPDSPKRAKIPPFRYISVYSSHISDATGWSYRILGYLVGRLQQLPKENCTQLPLYWYAGYKKTGECRETTQNLSLASSPAFLLPNYDWKSGLYSTWTESTWRDFSARIFLRPSWAHEAVTLAIGFVVMIISFVLVFLINSKSDILFNLNNGSPLASATPAPANC